MPSTTATNAMTGRGNLYTAPASTAGPADSVNFDGTWPAGWVFSGGTEEGHTLALSKSLEDVRFDEEVLAIDQFVEEAEFSVGTTLKEDTIENVKLAFGGGTITTTAAGSGIVGKKVLVLNNEVETVAVGLETRSPEGHWRRIIIPRAKAEVDAEVEIGRTKTRMYPVTFKAICPIGDIVIANKTANAT